MPTQYATQTEPGVWYQCQRCTNCCRWSGVVAVDDAEIAAIARFLEMSEWDFVQQYTRLRANRQGLALTEMPDGACVFLKGKDCLKEEAVWKLKQVELAINTDVDTAISAIQTDQQRVASARQASALAQDVVRMQNRRIEEGEGSTIDILDNRRRLYDAQSDLLAAIDDLNKSIVQLYLATGTLLREESIDLVDDDPDAPRHHPPQPH